MNNVPGILSKNIAKAFKNSFIQMCLEIIIEGYNETIKPGEYNTDWEEDNLTAQLILQMEKLRVVRKNQISINAQSPIYSTEMKSEGVSSKRAPVIDLKLSTWDSDIEHQYFFEAKNLSERNWTKANGASVSATYYINRYIDTGIKNFISGRYSNGSIIGYVVQGKTESILNKINTKIETQAAGIGTISKCVPVQSHKDSYISYNLKNEGEFEIRHTFLDFTI